MLLDGTYWMAGWAVGNQGPAVSLQQKVSSWCLRFRHRLIEVAQAIKRCTQVLLNTHAHTHIHSHIHTHTQFIFILILIPCSYSYSCPRPYTLLRPNSYSYSYPLSYPHSHPSNSYLKLTGIDTQLVAIQKCYIYVDHRTFITGVLIELISGALCH